MPDISGGREIKAQGTLKLEQRWRLKMERDKSNGGFQMKTNKGEEDHNAGAKKEE